MAEKAGVEGKVTSKAIPASTSVRRVEAPVAASTRLSSAKSVSATRSVKAAAAKSATPKSDVSKPDVTKATGARSSAPKSQPKAASAKRATKHAEAGTAIGPVKPAKAATDRARTTKATKGS